VSFSIWDLRCVQRGLGRYVIGSASGYTGADIYDGNDLIRESGGDAIVVVLQYRLGLFGFLAGAEVKSRGALNAGLRTLPILFSL
jgi:cholinesterase